MIERAVLLMTDRYAHGALLARVRELEQLGFESLWLPELFGREPIATAGFLLARTERIRVATGIANVYARDAHAMAQARTSLAELSRGRFLLGLGVSNAGINATRGHDWEPPLGKLRSYLDQLDAVAVHSPPPEQTAPLHLAAHGPQLQRLAAARANGVITFLMPVQHASETRARIGPRPELSAVVPFIAEREPVAARAKARAGLQMYLRLDYYQREWRKLGFEGADFAESGSDRLIDALVAWGDADALNARVAAFEQAGATRVVVNPLELHAGPGASLRVLEQTSPSN